jgi:pimeloyl-ACP methyl ester carboxylesterase
MRERNFETIGTNGVELRVVVEGEGPLVVLLHGWPQCWYLWRNQIDPIKEAGFRVAVPDQRGFGGSDCPPGVEDYNILELCKDVIGLVDALGEERAFLVGHDWGCIVAWHVALLYPHRLHCVTGMSVPYVRVEDDAWVNPPGRDDEFWYIRYFQPPGVAEAELEADIRLTLSALYFSASAEAPSPPAGSRPRDASLFPQLPTSLPLPRGVSQEDLDYYVEQFTKSGFRGGLNWYRNLGRNGALTPWLKEAKIRVPAHFIAGEKDLVLSFFPDFINVQDPWFADLRGKTLVPDAGHWLQQEQPEATTRAILAFLEEIRAEVGRS